MIRLRKITDHKMMMFLFFLCWFAYFTSYIGRLNYSSAMTAMIQDAILTKSQAGFISMVYFFAYGIGQMCNGLLGDKIHPGKMIFIGLFTAALANLVMGLVDNFFLMSVIWGINGYAQAMIWPPIIRIFAEMLEEKQKLRFCINIVSSQVVGTLGSYLIAAGVMWLMGWKAVFGTAAICLLAMSIVWLLGFRKIEKFSVDYGYLPDECKDKVKNTEKLSKKENVEVNTKFSRLLWSSGLLVIVFPVVVHGMLKDGVTTWVPTYITETFFTTPAFSILVTTFLPILNLTGAYAAQFVYQKCKRRELPAAICFFTVATLALTGIWAARDISMILTIVLFALITASMMAINTLFVNMLPLRFEKMGRVSTVSGFLNSMAYLGTAVSTFSIGVMVERLGWNITIGSWVMFTLAALVLCVGYRKRRF